MVSVWPPQCIYCHQGDDLQFTRGYTNIEIIRNNGVHALDHAFIVR